MKMLHRENIPCWYELSWRSSWRWPAIILRLHKDFLRDLPPMTTETPIVAHYLEAYKEFPFQGSFDRDFGFNGALRFKGYSGGFVVFHGLLPAIKEWSDEPCLHCDGSGWEPSGSKRCYSCEGKGKDYTYNWDLLLPLSASLAFITQLLAYPEKETSSGLSQLLEVQVLTNRRSEGEIYAVGGTYSVPLVRWMSSLGVHVKMSEMVEAMMIAYARMAGKGHLSVHRFRASIDSKGGWLNTDCPGDGCGLHPSDGSLEEGMGYEFSCHNVDSPVQQLTLLAGLAALHDRARREIQ